MTVRWSSRSLGSRLQHGIFYSLIRLTGATGGYCLLLFVVSWYVLRPSVRNRSKAYLRRRFPGLGFFGFFFHAWQLHWTFGRCLVDRAAAGILGGFSFEQNFPEKLEAVAGGEKGAVLLAAHTGCWQMSPYALSAYAGVPVALLAHKEHGDIDRQAHEHAGAAPPFQIIEASAGIGVPIALMNFLRQGGFLCMMGDRVGNGAELSVPVMFLGSMILVPVTAYRLASASGSPVVCAFALRTGPRRGRLCIADILRIPAGLGNNVQAYAPYAQRFASALEGFVRENPYQFFNFYDLWGY
jgi:predicted LPLAT superfamily acyltransferase